MLLRVLTALLLVAATVGGARADDPPACEKFKWSVARERAWFAAGPKPIESGADVQLAETAYSLTLHPNDSAGFVVAPERAPKAGSFGGVVGIALDKAGLYEVTLSDEAWIDVVQDGAHVASADFTGQKNCPGVRKSVRFDLAAGPASVQISNSQRPKIGVAIAPAQ